jgi:transcriptional regulator with XRE-family HTH domain
MALTIHPPDRGPRVDADAVYLRRLREARGLTQLELSVAAGVTPATVSRLENGHQAPTLVTLYKLAEALEVPVADLVCGHISSALRPPRQRRTA